MNPGDPFYNWPSYVGTPGQAAPLPNIGKPYAAISPTSVPDFKSLLDKVITTTNATQGPPDYSALLDKINSAIPKELPAPPDFSGLLQQATKAIPQNLPSFQDVLTQGMNSPLLQAVLQPAIQDLLPGEELARQSVNDQFRGAGALGGGAHAVGLSRLENALQANRSSLISKIISGIIPSLISGYGQQSQNAFNTSGQLIQSILGSMGPMANVYGQESKNLLDPAQLLINALTNISGQQTQAYGNQTGLLSSILRDMVPQMVSGASGGNAGGGAGASSGGGGGGINGGEPDLTGPDINKFPLSKVPYNPFNAFDFRPTPSTYAPLPGRYTPGVADPLAQYAINQGGSNNMGGGPTGNWQGLNDLILGGQMGEFTNIADYTV